MQHEVNEFMNNKASWRAPDDGSSACHRARQIVADRSRARRAAAAGRAAVRNQ
jgi:hypothetical protein